MRIQRSRLTRDYVQVPNATARDDRLSHMARGVLVEILSQPDGWEATADEMWRESAAKHGKDSPGRRAFRGAFAELKQYGYITTCREPLPGGRHSTVLVISDVPHAGTSVPPAETRNDAGHSDVPACGTSESGTSERPAETNEPAGRADVPTGGTSVPPGQMDVFAGHSDVPHAGTSSYGKRTTKTEEKTSSSTPAIGHHLDAFGAFWIVYPKKRAREEAKKAWIAAIERGANPQHIVTAATAYANERKGEDPKFTKYPATWLNKGCYDDELDPEPAPGRPPLRAVSGDWQPWTNPEDQSGYYESL